MHRLLWLFVWNCFILQHQFTFSKLQGCKRESIKLRTVASAVGSLLLFASGCQADTTFSQFLVDLDEGKISRVVFKGINPKSLVATYKSGAEELVSSGFPVEDPRGPSGAAQVIARVQHAPGVVCMQDVSELMSKSSKRRAEMRPMLSHAAYPAEFDRSRLSPGPPEQPASQGESKNGDSSGSP